MSEFTYNDFYDNPDVGDMGDGGFNIGDFGGGFGDFGGGGVGDFLDFLNPGGGNFGGTGTGGLFFDNETGQYVSFEDIMRIAPDEARTLNPQLFDQMSNIAGPQNQGSFQRFLNGLGGTSAQGVGSGLRGAAPLLSSLAGTGLAAAGLFSGGGNLRNPETDPGARNLLDIISKQSAIQQKLVNDTLKGSQYGKQEALREAGLDQLLAQIKDPNLVQSLFSDDDKVRQAANQQLLGVLEREGQASPTLLRQLAEQEQQLNEKFQASQGQGWNTSTPYLEAKAAFDRNKLEATADDALFRRGQEINTLSGIALPRSQFLQDVGNQNFARNVTATNQNPTTDALLKVMQAQGASAQTAGAGLSGYQNQANNLLNAKMFNLSEANKNRNSLLGGGGQLLGLGLYSMGRGSATNPYRG